MLIHNLIVLKGAAREDVDLAIGGLRAHFGVHDLDISEAGSGRVDLRFDANGLAEANAMTEMLASSLEDADAVHMVIGQDGTNAMVRQFDHGHQLDVTFVAEGTASYNVMRNDFFKDAFSAEITQEGVGLENSSASPRMAVGH